MRKVIFVIFLTSLLLSGGFAVRAQDAARAELSNIETDSFPTITALLDVYDAQGRFASGMDAASVTILEDSQPRPLTDLTEQDVGVQLVVAINPGPPMDTRDALGISRYDRIVEALRLWAEARPAENADDMSLVATVGPLTVNTTANEWRNSLVSFQPDARAAIPSLQSLSFALDIAEAQTSQPGMKRSILFLTPHLPDQATVDTLETLAQRASLSGVHVNVWLIDSEKYFVHFSANALKSLALQTGGDYFAFSGVELIPDPELYFAHLRRVYALKYDSRLTTAGNHLLAARVQLGELELISPEQTFALDVQPPNPMLVSPPAQIVRQPPADDPYNTEKLLPLEQTIEILVEFPDGHSRPLTRTALLVNGQAVAENTSAPFNLFIWDVSECMLSREYSLQVEVEDSLGLSKTSLGAPVTVTVVQPQTGILAFLGRNSSALTIGAVALAGILLGSILLIGGRKGLFSFAARRKKRQAHFDPVTQPVSIVAEQATSKKRKSQPRWARREKKISAPAYLVRLNGGDKPAMGKPIPLTGSEMTFGGDPVKATYVLDDPSISPLHARLRLLEENVYVISDQDSVAGTWVNLQQTDRAGMKLQHGDVIHLGQLRYRFELESPPEERNPQIIVEKSDQ